MRVSIVKKNGIIKQSSALPYPVPSANLQHWVENYVNHLGIVDNFTQLGTSGNGTAVSDASNHEIDLASNGGMNGHGRYESKKMWTPTTSPIIFTCIINNPILANNSMGAIDVGFKEDFSVAGILNSHGAIFTAAKSAGVTLWWFQTNNGNPTPTSTLLIQAPANGDILTVILTSIKTLFYINGVLKVEHTTKIPSNALKIGAGAYTTSTPTTATSVSIDYFNLVRYMQT